LSRQSVKQPCRGDRIDGVARGNTGGMTSSGGSVAARQAQRTKIDCSLRGQTTAGDNRNDAEHIGRGRTPEPQQTGSLACTFVPTPGRLACGRLSFAALRDSSSLSPRPAILRSSSI